VDRDIASRGEIKEMMEEEKQEKRGGLENKKLTLIESMNKNAED